jgi:hypothetical protein
MKTIENETEKPSWLGNLLNRLAVDTDKVRSFAFSVGPWGVAREGRVSLYYNGAVFLRLNWPFGWWLQLKWKADTRFQAGLGVKLNGRLGANFRLQTTESAARGTTGANSGQAQGWERGTT